MNLYRYFNKPEELNGYEDRLTLVHNLAFSHANSEIRGRFPEGESAIAKDVRHSYIYAKHVLKGRFPAGESIIAKNPMYRDRYNNEFGTNL